MPIGWMDESISSTRLTSLLHVFRLALNALVNRSRAEAFPAMKERDQIEREHVSWVQSQDYIRQMNPLIYKIHFLVASLLSEREFHDQRVGETPSAFCLSGLKWKVAALGWLFSCMTLRWVGVIQERVLSSWVWYAESRTMNTIDGETSRLSFERCFLSHETRCRSPSVSSPYLSLRC